jgi:hypothetical protein
VDHERGHRRQDDRVAVGLGLHDLGEADGAAAAGTVQDGDAPGIFLLHRLRHRPRHDVDHAAGRVRGHDGERSLGVLGQRGNDGAGQETGGEREGQERA